jgi:hypothetical protein
MKGERKTMNQEDLRRAFAVPTFQPQRIHLSNGETFDVRHPDVILIGPRTSALLVGDAIQVIANVYINHLEPLAMAG